MLQLVRERIKVFVSLGLFSRWALPAIVLAMIGGLPHICFAPPIIVYSWNDGTGNWSTASDWTIGSGPSTGEPPSGSGTYVVDIADSDGISRAVTFNVTSSGPNVLAVDLSGGTSGATNTLLMSAGTLSVGSEEIGGITTAGTDNGSGTVTQSGGTTSFTGGLFLAWSTGSSGTYNLSGTGVLSGTSSEAIGFGGLGTFNQNGGTNTLTSGATLYVGDGSGSAGSTYNLNSGSLSSANGENIGTLASGNFDQNGGSNQITSGNLAVGGLAGSSTGTGNYTLIAPGTAAPNNSATLSVAGNEIIGSAGSGYFTQGGVSTNTITGTSSLILANPANSYGSYDLTDSAQLSVGGAETIGNSGIALFQQGSSSSNTATGLLTIASGSASQATYSIGGSATLTANGGITVGGSGGGLFGQSGGTVQTTGANGVLTLAISTSSNGTYDLSGGSLTATFEIVGNSGAGTFSQTGSSTNTISSSGLGLFIASASTSTSSYSIANTASLNAGSGIVLGNYGAGTFTQTGGAVQTNSTGAITFGDNANSSGTWNQSGGSISTASETIGDLGVGAFTQTGGTNTVTGNLTVAFAASASGSSYSLNAGTLSVGGNVTVNTGGTFNFTTGSTLAYGGTFTLAGGTVNANPLPSSFFNYQSGAFYGGLDNFATAAIDLTNGNALSFGASGATSSPSYVILESGAGMNLAAATSGTGIGTLNIYAQSTAQSPRVGLSLAPTGNNPASLTFNLGAAGVNDQINVIGGSASVGAAGAQLFFNVPSGITGLYDGSYTLITANSGLGSGFSLGTFGLGNTVTVGQSTYNLSLSNSTSSAELLTVTGGNYYWIDPAGWNNPANWSTYAPGGPPATSVPQATSNVVIANSDNMSRTVTYDSSVTPVDYGSLTINQTGGGGATNTLEMAGGTLNADNVTVGGGGVIDGYGNINDNVALNNTGTINADGNQQYLVVAAASINNSSTMEATNGGGLFINSSDINNYQGTIYASGYPTISILQINSAVISGGTLSSDTSSYIDLKGTGTELDGYSQGSMYIHDNVLVDSYSPVTLAGTINDIGVITDALVLPTNGNTFSHINAVAAMQLQIGDPTENSLTLTGSGGQIVMAGSAQNNTPAGTSIISGYSNATTLTVDSGDYIASAGNGIIENLQTLTNYGFVLSSTSPNFYGAGGEGALDAFSSLTVQNIGTVNNSGASAFLEANGGSLTLDNLTINNNSGAQILANILGALFINGGYVFNTGGSQIRAFDSVLTINGAYVDNTGQSQMISTVYGRFTTNNCLIDNSGGTISVSMGQTTTPSTLVLNSTAVEGGTLTSDSQTYIDLTGSSTDLNGYSEGNLTIYSNVLVDSASPVMLAGSIVNDGTISDSIVRSNLVATAVAPMNLKIGDPFENSATLSSDIGGEIIMSGSAEVGSPSGTSTISGYSSNNTLTVGSDNTIDCIGLGVIQNLQTLNNSGTIMSGGQGPEFVTSLLMQNIGTIYNNRGALEDFGGTFNLNDLTIDNDDNSFIIAAAGQLNINGGTVENSSGSTVRADVGTLTINNAVVTNSSTLTSMDSGNLTTNNCTIYNSAGTIQAMLGSFLTPPTLVLNSSYIEGGTLQTDSSTYIDLKGTGTELYGPSSQEPLTISSGSDLLVDSTSWVALAGNITNNGTISDGLTINGVRTTALAPMNLQIGDSTNTGSATLDGTGSIQMTESGSTIAGISPGSQLTNGSQHTIQGQGTIENLAGIANYGSIVADIPGQMLSILNVPISGNGHLRAIEGGKLYHDPDTVTCGSLSTDSISSMEFDGDTITAGCVNNAGTLSLVNSSLTVTGQYTNTGQVNLQGGSLSLTGGGAESGNVSVGSGTVLTYSGNNSFAGGSTIGGAGEVAFGSGISVFAPGATLDPTGPVSITGALQLQSTQTLDSLTISGNGQLDITSTHILIDYGSSDPISAIAAYIKSGFNNGQWNGPGIISSTAQTPTNGHNYGVGFADGADGVFSGLPAGEIEIKYTLLGDANLDGTVNGSDFSILAANFGLGVANWDQGNFLYGSSVNGSDFSALAANFGQGDSGAAVAVSQADINALDSFAIANNLPLPTFSAVPEPTIAALMTLTALSALSQRRRHRQKNR
jgi:fibronectin-binding autotransporter adhesin